MFYPSTNPNTSLSIHLARSDGSRWNNGGQTQTQTQYKQMCMYRPHTQEEDSERVICIMGTQTHIATHTDKNIKYTLTIAMYLGYLR